MSTTQQATHKARRIARALPSPADVAMFGLFGAALFENRNLPESGNEPLLWLALGFGLYTLVTHLVSVALDPKCEDPAHRRCVACGDLPSISFRSAMQRVTRKATSR